MEGIVRASIREFDRKTMPKDGVIRKFEIVSNRHKRRYYFNPPIPLKAGDDMGRLIRERIESKQGVRIIIVEPVET